MYSYPTGIQCSLHLVNPTLLAINRMQLSLHNITRMQLFNRYITNIHHIQSLRHCRTNDIHVQIINQFIIIVHHIPSLRH